MRNDAPPRPDEPRRRLTALPFARPDALRMVVDLSPLRPGGESGGVKPFIVEYLRQLAASEGGNLVLIYLTSSASHAEVSRLARPCDETVCVRQDDPNAREAIGTWRSGEWQLPAPPANLLLMLRADLFYAPLISADYACPGVPTLSTVVDVLHRDYPDTLPREVNANREVLFKRLVRVSDRLQCISVYTAGQMALHFGVPPERTFCSHIVIHHRFKVAGGNQSGKRSAEPFFFYPANAWAHKNHETLLVAYRQYRHRHGAAAWPLVLTGHEDERMHRLRETARDLGLSDHVNFRGHLDEEEFGQLMSEAGVLVFPSLHEGFGIPLVEAMHFGLPILSNRAGSLQEVAGDAARYADALNPTAWAGAMLELATDATLRSELAAKGARRLSEFSLPAEIAEFREVVSSLAKGPVRRWHRGIHPDGWTEGMAILGLPSVPGRMRISLSFGPQPASRRVRLFRGLVPWGGLDVKADRVAVHDFEFQGGRDPLVIEVPDSANLRADDHRMHGVIVAKATAVDERGVEYNLLEDGP